MLVTNGVLRHRYDEKADKQFPLGRHIELDARSLAYTVEGTPEFPYKPIAPAEWMSGITTLNQGHLGSCTGNAGTYHLASALGANNLGKAVLAGKTLTNYDAAKNEEFAVELYHEASVADGFPGDYPPDDTGSSGLAICKVLKKAGLIKGYQWVTTVRGVAAALQTGGVIIGTPWYEAWFTPDSKGFVDNGAWTTSPIAGGHEIYIEALESYDSRDPRKSVIRFRNSWGDGWGDHGAGRMTLSTYNALKQQIDVKQYRP